MYQGRNKGLTVIRWGIATISGRREGIDAEGSKGNSEDSSSHAEI
jgi:hypothetical protein